MKYTVKTEVAEGIYSDNFPGVNLSPDIAGLVNLIKFQLGKRLEYSFNHLYQLREYILKKIQIITEELTWVFDSPEGNLWVLTNGKLKYIEFQYIVKTEYEEVNIFSIGISWEGEFQGEQIAG